MPAENLLKLFGTVSLEGPGFCASKFPTRRSLLLLARLALAKGQRLGREELCDLLWPDDYHEQSRERLRQELSRLRAAVGPFARCIEADRRQIWITGGCLSTDVAMFESGLARASAAQGVQDRIGALKDALAIVQGPLLSGSQAPWVVTLRRAYEDKARRAWLCLAEGHDLAGSPDEAMEANLGALRQEPLDLEANSQLIKRLVERGQIARARHVYQEFDAALSREMGRRAPVSARGPLAQLWEEMESARPIPVARPKPLIGREELLAEVLALLGDRGARVVLVGLPGSGKSHLAEEIAWRFSREAPIPVHLGGTIERVDDGLFVCDEGLGVSELRAVIDQAARNGWRVLACSRSPIASGASQIAVPPLPVPKERDSSEEILRSPSVRLLSSSVAHDADSGRYSAESMARLARELGGIPAALRSFSRRIAAQDPERILGAMDEALRAFANEPRAKGETFADGIRSSLDLLPEEARVGLCRLAVLGEASVELANSLIAPSDPTEVWPTLEESGMVVRDEGRLGVPGPILWTVRRLCGSELARIERDAWTAAVQWAYRTSRKPAARLHFRFDALLAEVATFRRGLDWCVQNDPGLAGRLVAAIWRTTAARGTPSIDAPALHSAVQAAAIGGPCEIVGEAWLGTAIVLAMTGQTELAESCFLASIETYQACCDVGGWTWATMNYGAIILLRTNPSLAVDLCELAADETPSWNVRQLARVTQSYALAIRKEFREATRIAEEVFAERLKDGDEVDEARGYAELGHVYLLAGQLDAAKPLVSMGARKLRETGIQDLLLEALLDIVVLSEEVSELKEVLGEATSIARRLGSTASWIEIGRARVRLASRSGDRDALVAAIDELFQHTQDSGSERERCASLRLLAQVLDEQGGSEYANAISAALGDSVEGAIHAGWQSVLGSDSHTTVCVLATVLAKEALTKKGSLPS